MEFFRIRRTIPFMHYSLYLNIASVVMFCLAVFFLATRGLAFSIEFTGGTTIEVKYPNAANTDQIRQLLVEKISPEASVQNYGTAKDVLIRVPLKKGETSGQQAKEVMAVLSAQTPGVVQHSVEFVGPQVGKQLATDGFTALALVVLGIMIYLAFRFEWKFSVAAVIANMHDLVIVAGLFSFFQWEFTLQVLTGLLAVLGYSVNESVIIFDRVREHFRTMRRADTIEVINSAITATISRTVITHGSTLCMTLSMFFFGGPALHNFALALTIGICCSVYSSVFVAAAIAMYLKVTREDLVHKVKKQEISEMVP
ncbi:MAG: protein translocase subunit SecF [Sutterellaceae bacterium]|nr:protein translocase subunit SecF [Sutterellaceae bacterium]MDY2867418.1 protein translocase subunit SecF [Mesosutterella sp.]